MVMTERISAIYGSGPEIDAIVLRYKRDREDVYILAATGMRPDMRTMDYVYPYALVDIGYNPDFDY